MSNKIIYLITTIVMLVVATMFGAIIYDMARPDGVDILIKIVCICIELLMAIIVFLGIIMLARSFIND